MFLHRMGAGRSNNFVDPLTHIGVCWIVAAMLDFYDEGGVDIE